MEYQRVKERIKNIIHLRKNFLFFYFSNSYAYHMVPLNFILFFRTTFFISMVLI
ncbi:hypothetical protein HAN_3g372 (nucleomorph) [Hemiselmis andersenii]|uniref:Uncharacterized protein n=1 Tax=Hemiselmis andersenii TaxID=464988 RepID=A9BK22_HEMAN|nr:hypothetical protein HAN_1g7 [Hemiselmis andersenii]XP_001712337.1 hypothetical protein HAN_1g177 [Hemiselmis andersenii]XP_001712508.1 hypothetical protein HAN_3g372 [Hemiselmis andersenii]ABW97855.1 hypothetical protein HAN_1g7 [Hemiselmis andersenii]ABW98012.1 hypothetical protein HAN_1g177 [Hemiselmis andersenii]ABW98183.1 hypothetical protein HAN_3g372 [Hemiselmis andersenii]